MGDLPARRDVTFDAAAHMRVMGDESTRTIQSLAIYGFEGCPYCELVMASAAKLGLALEWRDIERDQEHRRALLTARGRATVPVLRIERVEEPDEWMPESADIVRFLETHVGRTASGTSLDRSVRAVTWILLILGGFALEPGRAFFWTTACALAAGRSVKLAMRTKAARHWLIAGTLAFASVAIALDGLGVASVPWWNVGFAVVAGLVLERFARGARRRSGPES